MSHPFHDDIARAVRSWYLEPAPEMGYTAEPRWFGVVRGNTEADFASATVTDLADGDVGRFADELRSSFGRRAVRVQVESAAITPSLDAALVDDGFVRGETTTYLLHCGSLPEVSSPTGFEFDPIDAAGVPEFSRVKLQAFGSTEEAPSPADVAHENVFRRAELTGSNGFAIGRINGDAAGIIGWYGGDDSLIFLVATRVPFRRRGLASTMICRVRDHVQARGGRSVLINADVDDDPVVLYRRLGFTDEVLRHHIYELQA